ncbi:dTDP-4-dehydrorhamnose 3,5-epimerase [Beggiatoa leptomitoformis]|uniref:dTDP-4-dehydrorhamnose 3,5-epimerase n=1 Tax=Beggiatoa leptomitoformis TaxID=288004 RepID=A0A2N9YFZ7_9GAMM|nr:dTDP-4-dehydrorhamnose 3,5-epimerase [Beggiatoa leptomitoformis]ALG68270.1 dTDP-4-dehydrorhamnose 3,5-epimerase [Beggiatoa leptomitoformis]AUI69420.1 dTDP-4-dehydrorhamnose 3,5-epimerase [Beggiatoa leptomitoformis]
MKVIKTAIPEVLLIEPRVFGDERGFFLESYNQQRYIDAGVTERFVQDNHSHSAKNVLRGLHFQREHPQGKLVYVTKGIVFDVAVDIRKDSPTYKKWVGAILTADNHHQFYVPAGFAHGFCVLSDTADFHYKCTEYYHPKDEASLRWDDPDIGITWPISKPILSQKDADAPYLNGL